MRQLWNLEELPTDETLIGKNWNDSGIDELDFSTWSPDNHWLYEAMSRFTFQINMCNEFIRTIDKAAGMISDDEIAFLTGKKDIDQGIAEILRKNRPILICATMGKYGSKAYYQGKSVFCEPFLRDDTIETTGAGDTFMACVLNAVLEKRLDSLTEDDLHEMLRFANAASSIITTRKGALKVMPKREEIISVLTKE